MSQRWWPTNPKDIFPWFLHFVTLCLWWIHWFASHLIYLSLTKLIMQQCFHPCAKHCFTGTWHLVLLNIFFVLMQVKIGTFLPIHRCAFDFCLISNIFSYGYASKALRMELSTLISSIKLWCYTWKIWLWKDWTKRHWLKSQDYSNQTIRYA